MKKRISFYTKLWAGIVLLLLVTMSVNSATLEFRTTPTVRINTDEDLNFRFNQTIYFNESYGVTSQVFKGSKSGPDSIWAGGSANNEGIVLQANSANGDNGKIFIDAQSKIRYTAYTDHEFYEQTTEIFTIKLVGSQAEIVSPNSLFINATSGVVNIPSQQTSIINSNGKVYSASEANLQAAIDDLSNATGWVYVPSMIEITNGVKVGNGTTLYGEGKGGLTLADSANVSLIENYDQTNGNHNITIRNLIFEGNGKNQDGHTRSNLRESDPHCIEIYSENPANDINRENRDVLITGCTFNNSKDSAIYVENARDIIIRDSSFANSGLVFYGNGVTAYSSSGVAMVNTDFSRMENLVVRDCFGVGLWFETDSQESPSVDGDRIWEDYKNYSHDNVIADCTIYNCHSGIYNEDVVNMVIENCYTYNNAKSEAYAGDSSWGIRNTDCINVTVKGCTSRNDGNDVDSVSIYINKGHNCSIVDCYVYNATGEGIRVGYEYCEVIGCTVIDANGEGIVYRNINGKVVNNFVKDVTVGILATGIDPDDNNQTIIENNIIEQTSSYGIHSYQPNTKICNNYINKTGDNGIKLQSDSGIDDFISVNDNHIKYATSRGILFDAGGANWFENISCSNNMIDMCINNGIGIYFTNCIDGNVIGNRVINAATGIRNDAESDWFIIIGNNVRHNGNPWLLASETGGSNCVNSTNLPSQVWQ